MNTTTAAQRYNKRMDAIFDNAPALKAKAAAMRHTPEDMAYELTREGVESWVAVGLTDKDGFAASVAYCHPGNAPLIAAAPDLLAALEAWKAHGFAVPISDHPEAVAQRKLHALVDAAIAKARGNS
jgi:hypothetical protein